MQPSKKAIFSGYVAQALSIGYGILILPFMLGYLSPAEVAYWLIMLSFLGLVMVFDFGFSPTITRNIAYVMSGAEKLLAHGVYEDNMNELNIDNREANWRLFNQLLYTVKLLYRYIALIALIIFGTFGSWYVYIFLANNPVESGWVVWVIFLSGFILNLYFLYTYPTLMGMGKLYQANMVNIIMRVVWLIFAALGLWYFESILVMPVSYFLGVVVARVYAYYLINKHAILVRFEKSALFSIILPNAWRLGVVIFGAFLINKATIFFAGVYFQAELSASYMLSLQVLAVLIAVASVYFQMHIPELSRMQLAYNARKKKLYYKLISISLFIYIVSALMVLVFGNGILNFIGSEVGFLPLEIFSLLLFIGLLELNHTLAATYITTQNKVPFLWASILSGIAIVLFSIIIFAIYRVNELIWLILIQGSVQLAYNNWKWPYCVFKDLKDYDKRRYVAKHFT